jgi:hypothetical protein
MEITNNYIYTIIEIPLIRYVPMPPSVLPNARGLPDDEHRLADLHGCHGIIQRISRP